MRNNKKGTKRPLKGNVNQFIDIHEPKKKIPGYREDGLEKEGDKEKEDHRKVHTIGRRAGEWTASLRKVQD